MVNEMNEVSRLQVCSICYTIGYGTGFDSVIGEITCDRFRVISGDRHMVID